MKKKFLPIILSLVFIILSLSCGGCNNTNKTQNKDQVLAIYNEYVSFYEQKGQVPLSYEEWILSLKGDNGVDGMSPTIEIIEGYWYINGKNTGVKTQSGFSADDLFSPIIYNTTWESGNVNLQEGIPLYDLKNDARQRTGYLSFNERVNIVSDGTYKLTLCLCDENLNLERYIVYTDISSGEFLCVPSNTTFRLMIYDAIAPAKDISDITSEEINSHIKVYRNGTSYIANPQVRWCAMGDSITQGFVSTGATAPNNPIPAKGWAQKLADMKNWEIVNKGVGGSGWIQGGTNPPQPAWQVASLTDFTQFDLVTLAYGINDWNVGIDIGSIENYDPSVNPTTMVSSMCKTFDTIIASNPFCKIVVITPLNCWWKGDETTNWALGAENGSGVTLEQFVETIKYVCEYYCIEYIDMTHNSIVNRKNIQNCLLDKVHPTAETHTAIAHELAAKIPFN